MSTDSQENIRAILVNWHFETKYDRHVSIYICKWAVHHGCFGIVLIYVVKNVKPSTWKLHAISIARIKKR